VYFCRRHIRGDPSSAEGHIGCHTLALLGGAPPRLETTGARSQLVALVAAALEPQAFSELVARDGLKSLSQVVDEPVE
jgi:hypothetical protein